jgi:hypothetical protein
VILAHHAGEDVVLMLAASGVGGVSMLATVMRARITRLVGRFRKW